MSPGSDFSGVPRPEVESPRQRIEASPKAGLVKILGGYSSPLRWYRRFRPRWLWRRSSLFGMPTTRYVDQFGLVVRHGPFEGMVYPDSLFGRSNHLASKLLGTYEPPVVDLVAACIKEADLFVDIGAGDGFFCVGAALSAEDGQALQVVAYELNRFERRMIERLARENQVSVEVRGAVTGSSLAELSSASMVVLCDVEGLEAEILDPAACPPLVGAILIVEVHDQIVPGVSDRLRSRFEATHEIERIDHRSPDPLDRPELSGWDRESAEVAVFDGHGEGEGWLLMKPRPEQAEQPVEAQRTDSSR